MDDAAPPYYAFPDTADMYLNQQSCLFPRGGYSQLEHSLNIPENLQHALPDPQAPPLDLGSDLKRTNRLPPAYHNQRLDLGAPPVSNEKGPSTIGCPSCGTRFTGDWAKGNLRRHRKAKHESERNPDLQCLNCHEWFNRKDAKIVHMRKTHQQPNDEDEEDARCSSRGQPVPELAEPSFIVPPYSSSRQYTSLHSAGQMPLHTISLYISGNEGTGLQGREFCMQLHKQSKHKLFIRVSNLPHKTLKSFVENSEAIVHYMRVTRPHDKVAIGFVSVFKQLQDAIIVYSASRTPRSATDTTPLHVVAGGSGPSSDAHAAERPRPDRNAPNRRPTDPRRPSDHRPERPPTNRNVTAASRGRPRGSGKLYACPIQKHCEVYRVHTTCHFEGKPNMWGVVQHLKTRKHGCRSIKLCHICWRYYLEDQCQNAHTPLAENERLPQPRGAAQIEQWIDLYLKLYPDLSRIPSVYIGETGWSSERHSSSVSAAGPSTPNSSGSNGTQQTPPDAAESPNSSPEPGTATSDLMRETAAAETLVFILADSFRERTDLNRESMRQIICQARPLTSEEVPEVTQRLLEIAGSSLAQLFRIIQEHVQTSSQSSSQATTAQCPCPEPANGSSYLNAGQPGFLRFNGHPSTISPVAQEFIDSNYIALPPDAFSIGFQPPSDAAGSSTCYDLTPRSLLPPEH